MIMGDVEKTIPLQSERLMNLEIEANLLHYGYDYGFVKD